MSKDQADIRALIESIHNSRHNKDAAAVVGPCAPEATVFNLAPPLSHRGMDLQETQAWLDTWDGPIELEPKDVKITVSGDSAFYYGFLHMTGTKKGPEGKVDFWMRWTVCLERQTGAWKIVHEHASVPF